MFRLGNVNAILAFLVVLATNAFRTTDTSILHKGNVYHATAISSHPSFRHAKNQVFVSTSSLLVRNATRTLVSARVRRSRIPAASNATNVCQHFGTLALLAASRAGAILTAH